MIQKFYTLEITTSGQKLYEFTDKTIEWIKKLKFKNGILNLSIQHTSASLIVQENADPDVQIDLINYFNSELKITTKTISSSIFNISQTKTRKLVDICSKVDATCYISGISGHDYLNEKLFLESKIELIYENFIHPTYNQIHGGFIENMSIIDLLMNTGEHSKKILSDTVTSTVLFDIGM